MGHAAERPEIVWSASRAERERAASETATDRLHLSRAQKWDLVRICVAALASAAFFSAPFLLSRDSSSVADTTIATPAIPVEHGGSLHAALDRISVVTTDIVVPVQSVSIQSAPRSPRRPPRGVTVRASNDAHSGPATETRSLARRLGRAIAGDGRYTVRPFPSVDSNQE